jgi:hypothetical protein
MGPAKDECLQAETSLDMGAWVVCSRKMGEFQDRLFSSNQESSEFVVSLALRSIDYSGWVVYKLLIVYIFSNFITIFSTVNSCLGPKSSVRQIFHKPESSLPCYHKNRVSSLYVSKKNGYDLLYRCGVMITFHHDIYYCPSPLFIYILINM